MADMLKIGAAFLATQLKANASQTIVYARGVYSVSILASLGSANYDMIGEDGALISLNNQDFLFDVADLIINSVASTPQKGDTLTYGTTVYTVNSGTGGSQVFKYTDGYKTRVRVYTVRDGNSN